MEFDLNRIERDHNPLPQHRHLVSSQSSITSNIHHRRTDAEIEHQQTYLSNFSTSHVIQNDLKMIEDERMRVQQQPTPKPGFPILPYLLLDVRNHDEYSMGHIVGGF